MRLAIAILLAAITLSCGIDWAQYEYADGNGNLYMISKKSIAYFPVKPEESSTGTYSGGEPKTVSLTPEQFESIRELLENAIHHSSNHIQDRVKMSGVISVLGENDKTQYILAPGSPEIKNIETLLKGIIGN